MFERAAIVGIAWYRREDWDALRALFVDADVLPDTWDAWLSRAREIEQQVGRDGRRAVRAEIRPEAFRTWCADNGHALDAKGRMAFANAAALAEYRKTN